MSEILPGLCVGPASEALYPDVAAYDLIINVKREIPFSKLLADHQQAFRFDILDIDLPDQASMTACMHEAVPLPHGHALPADVHRAEDALPEAEAG